MIHVCYKCGQVVEEGMIGFRAACQKCSSNLHCCKNCRFYDKVAPHQCRIYNAEPVADKEKYNFCDDFKFKEGGQVEKNSSSREDGLNKWESLFKK